MLHTSCSVIPREAVFYIQRHCGTCEGSVVKLGPGDSVIHVGQSCIPKCVVWGSVVHLGPRDIVVHMRTLLYT